jgi:hypothetical protein
MSRSSTDSAKALQQWGCLRDLLSRRRSAASADPIATVVARVAQEEELQDSEEENGDVEQIGRNGATEGSRILSDPVGMELSKMPEAYLENNTSIENKVLTT